MQPDLDAGWQSIDWSAHTHDAVIRGRRIRYADIGTGPAAVFVHGQGGSWQWWLRTMAGLAPQCRLIALDLPGFGSSETVEGADVFYEHIETVVGLLDHLRLAKAMVVGHSMGGLVSIQVASEYPERVSGLTVVDGGGANFGPRRLRLILAVLRVAYAMFSVPRITRLIATNRWLRTALMSLAIANHRSFTTALALEILPRMAAPGFMATLKSAGAAVSGATPQAVRCPSLLIWGAQDRILPLSTGRRMAAAIPDARLVSLDHVGHCPMIEATDEFNRLVRDFLLDPAAGRPDTYARPDGATA